MEPHLHRIKNQSALEIAGGSRVIAAASPGEPNPLKQFNGARITQQCLLRLGHRVVDPSLLLERGNEMIRGLPIDQPGLHRPTRRGFSKGRVVLPGQSQFGDTEPMPPQRGLGRDPPFQPRLRAHAGEDAA